MTQLVQAFGHTVEFPDGMSQDDITAALKKNALSVPSQIANDPISLGAKNFAQNMSPWDQFFSGAGKAVSDLGSGIQQLGTKIGIGNPAAVQAQIDQARQLDAPLMNTAGGMAGNVAGNVAMTVLPAGGVLRGAEALNAARTANVARAFINPTTYTGAAGAGAALGAIQPVATGDSRALNTGLGAVSGGVGQGVVNGLGRIAQPVQNVLDPIRQKAVDTLTNAGVPLDLAQVTGSPVWNRLKSSLSDNLFTLGGQAAKQADQKQAFNAAALNLIGQPGAAATSDVMGAAQSRINGVFKDVLDRNSVQATPSWIGPLADVHASALENEKQPVVNVVNRILNNIDPQTGQIPGQVAYGIKTDLDRMANTQDPTQKYLALRAKSALMDGINSSLTGDDQQAFAQARGQFSNMMKLEPAIAKDGTGDISPSILANVMAQKGNRAASIYGKGPQAMVDLAQSGKQLLTDKTPNSGTAARIAAAILPGAVAAGGAQLITGDPMEALKYGVGVAGIPKGAQFILNNPTSVGLLSRGVENPTLRGLLELPQKSVMAGQFARSLPALAGRSLLPAVQ